MSDTSTNGVGPHGDGCSGHCWHVDKLVDDMGIEASDTHRTEGSGVQGTLQAVLRGQSAADQRAAGYERALRDIAEKAAAEKAAADLRKERQWRALGHLVGVCTLTVTIIEIALRVHR